LAIYLAALRSLIQQDAGKQPGAGRNDLKANAYKEVLTGMTLHLNNCFGQRD